MLSVHDGVKIGSRSIGQRRAVGQRDGQSSGHTQKDAGQLGALPREGMLVNAGDKPVSKEQMKLALVKMERDVRKRAGNTP